MNKIPVKLIQTVMIDEEIAAEIRWLNESGVPTVASCCGHGQSPPTALIKPGGIEKAKALGYEPLLQFSDEDRESLGLFQIELGKLGEPIELRETGSQPYIDCKFSSGLIIGHSHDTLYLRLERDGADEFVLYLRPDEALAIIWLLSGALWSQELSNTTMAIVLAGSVS